ncbi:hypothetical protein FQN54_000137 [Arachnomyces sp. PD_36]|nr:hypothetical protein FQN54_000137 [Arachnomyces sp. PD_36]
MREIPPEVLAGWPKPNYVNPESRARGIVIAAAILMPIVLLVFSTGYSIATLVGIKVGWYIHVWDLHPSRVTQLRKLIVGGNLCGLWNVGFTKLSILCLYLHIAPPSRFQTSVYVLIGITMAWLVSLTITNFLLCIPLRAYWEPTFVGEHKCVDEVGYYVTFTSLDLALDMVIYLLPLPVLIPLKMPKRQKAIVVGVFGLGILVIAAAAIRMPSFVRASSSFDLSWEMYDAALWTEIESAVGIVCASVPALKPLVQKYLPTALGSLMSARAKGSAESPNASGGVQRQTRDSSWYNANGRLTHNLEHGLNGWDWDQGYLKHGSHVGLVHELGTISGAEYVGRDEARH